jgi:hypothetical protein
MSAYRHFMRKSSLSAASNKSAENGTAERSNEAAESGSAERSNKGELTETMNAASVADDQSARTSR